MKNKLPWFISLILLAVVVWGAADLGFLRFRNYKVAVTEPLTALLIARAFLNDGYNYRGFTFVKGFVKIILKHFVCFTFWTQKKLPKGLKHLIGSFSL